MESLLKFAEYGLGALGFACIVAVVYIFVNKKKKDANPLLEVINNNTKAFTELTTYLQVTNARIEQKIDEVLAYIRR